ncbi:hypothetical protein AYI68_g4933 [Smittium mucronatum]|uniref:Uncharacterized protein n=1 Tax=Smittium mucronatum TaxID=133383 RepID=A0A1R0GVP0_9FUNG|nr:hypothetical protein AYI68_g6463 [Smittium mucronatum]OLY80964.1 hypothetical protein AYI68_g4933 [Smittium mucronatum]
MDLKGPGYHQNLHRSFISTDYQNQDIFKGKSRPGSFSPRLLRHSQITNKHDGFTRSFLPLNNSYLDLFGIPKRPKTKHFSINYNRKKTMESNASSMFSCGSGRFRSTTLVSNSYNTSQFGRLSGINHFKRSAAGPSFKCISKNKCLNKRKPNPSKKASKWLNRKKNPRILKKPLYKILPNMSLATIRSQNIYPLHLDLTKPIIALESVNDSRKLKANDEGLSPRSPSILTNGNSFHHIDAQVSDIYNDSYSKKNRTTKRISIIKRPATSSISKNEVQNASPDDPQMTIKLSKEKHGNSPVDLHASYTLNGPNNNYTLEPENVSKFSKKNIVLQPIMTEFNYELSGDNRYSPLYSYSLSSHSSFGSLEKSFNSGLKGNDRSRKNPTATGSGPLSKIHPAGLGGALGIVEKDHSFNYPKISPIIPSPLSRVSFSQTRPQTQTKKQHLSGKGSRKTLNSNFNRGISSSLFADKKDECPLNQKNVRHSIFSNPVVNFDSLDEGYRKGLISDNYLIQKNPLIHDHHIRGLDANEAPEKHEAVFPRTVEPSETDELDMFVSKFFPGRDSANSIKRSHGRELMLSKSFGQEPSRNPFLKHNREALQTVSAEDSNSRCRFSSLTTQPTVSNSESYANEIDDAKSKIFFREFNPFIDNVSDKICSSKRVINASSESHGTHQKEGSLRKISDSISKSTLNSISVASYYFDSKYDLSEKSRHDYTTKSRKGNSSSIFDHSTNEFFIPIRDTSFKGVPAIRNSESDETKISQEQTHYPLQTDETKLTRLTSVKTKVLKNESNDSSLFKKIINSSIIQLNRSVLELNHRESMNGFRNTIDTNEFENFSISTEFHNYDCKKIQKIVPKMISLKIVENENNPTNNSTAKKVDYNNDSFKSFSSFYLENNDHQINPNSNNSIGSINLIFLGKRNSDNLNCEISYRNISEISSKKNVIGRLSRKKIYPALSIDMFDKYETSNGSLIKTEDGELPPKKKSINFKDLILSPIESDSNKYRITSADISPTNFDMDTSDSEKDILSIEGSRSWFMLSKMEKKNKTNSKVSNLSINKLEEMAPISENDKAENFSENILIQKNLGESKDINEKTSGLVNMVNVELQNSSDSFADKEKILVNSRVKPNQTNTHIHDYIPKPIPSESFIETPTMTLEEDKPKKSISSSKHKKSVSSKNSDMSFPHFSLAKISHASLKSGFKICVQKLKNK